MAAKKFGTVLKEAQDGGNSYLHRTALSIAKNCAVRGVSDKDRAGLVTAIEKEFGGPLAGMNERTLLRVNRKLPYLVAEV